MLELTDIEAGYGRTLVLHGVTVPAGKVVAVLGHNGAGKTTLLRVAIGLIKPSKGRVIFDGEDITSLAPNKRVARGMAYVPQGQQAFGQLTTLENLQLVADGRRRGKALIDAQLARFPALEKFASPEGRPALGRAAPAARDRPRPHHRAEAAHPRRADRGHPAHDRRRDRAHHHAAGRARASTCCSSSSTSASPSRPPSSYVVLASGFVTQHRRGGLGSHLHRASRHGDLSRHDRLPRPAMLS